MRKYKDLYDVVDQMDDFVDDYYNAKADNKYLNRENKALKDITLGKLWNNNEQPLTQLTAVIGKNGVGKSSIFDAFGFISDCLKNQKCVVPENYQYEKVEVDSTYPKYILDNIEKFREHIL